MILDYFGTIVFAISGCIVAARKQSDILAFILLGLVTAVGGGTLRDLLIGRTPLFWLTNHTYLLICIVTAFIMFIGLQHIQKSRHYKFILLWSDAIGISTFSILGTHIALTSGIAPVPAILLGVSTACFGGILRDMLSHEVTLIFMRDIYMTACIAGSITYSLLFFSDYNAYAAPVGFVACFILRALAIKYSLKLPGHRYFESE
tara:strand:+ start:743 stop:1354 length:612 start_codon:yes stop_codon:yes gene_type:complete